MPNKLNLYILKKFFYYFILTLVVLSAILGRTPTLEEYKQAIRGIQLTRFAPPLNEMTSKPGHLLSY